MESKMKVSADTIEFYNTNKFYFPKVCLICAKYTENRVQKYYHHDIDYSRSTKKAKSYQFQLPICKECHQKIKIQKKLELIKLLLPLMIGIIGAFVLFFITFSWLISLSFFTVLAVMGVLYLRSRLLSRLQLEDFISLKFRMLKQERLNNIVQITFSNKKLVKLLGKINKERNEDLQIVLDFEDENLKKNSNKND
ncbi:MAG: ABC transporter ATP-binding protein [Promethearchaeota archaeon]|nr:MAG: ABC transporter ATP-binding protein [Candidatus Lokiarchaeota archaeon]